MKSVTADGWNVSVTTGSGISGAILSVFHGFAPSGRARYGEANGLRFANSKEAFAYSLARGYSVSHYRRNSYWMELRLSRRSRRWLRENEERLGRHNAVGMLLSGRHQEWLNQVGLRYDNG